MKLQSFDIHVPKLPKTLLVGGKKFTKREIDILSLVGFGGRQLKTTANILGLSIKTIETYLLSIRRKISESSTSREDLIEFIEKSEEYDILFKHYSLLRLEYEFISLLKNTSKYIDKDWIVYIPKSKEFLEQVDFKKINNFFNTLKIEIKEKENKESHIVWLENSTLSKIIELKIKFNSSDEGIIINFYEDLIKVLNTLTVKSHEELKQDFKEFSNILNSLSCSNNNLRRNYNEELENKNDLPGKRFILKKFISFTIAIFLLIGSATIFTKSYKSAGPYKEQVAPSPWNTPYMPESFIKRKKLKKKIINKLNNNSQKLNKAVLVGLHGLGGIGKTYLAMDIIYNPHKKYDFRGWITSNDEDKIKSDFLKLGRKFKLFKSNIEEEVKISLVIDWLNNRKSLLLIFDNTPNLKILQKYLPQKGDVVITSRNYNLPQAIEVDVMDREEAIKLLRSIIPQNTSSEEIEKLVNKLGYLPLAIAQAGAYIEQSKISINKYIKLYEAEQKTLLSINTLPLSHRHIPAYISWKINTDEIISQDNTGKVKELLNLISFCHFVDIPKSFLTHCLYGDEDPKSEIKLNNLIILLKKYSFIKATSDSIAMHHLVQDSIRESIDIEERKKIIKKSIKIIEKLNPIDVDESYSKKTNIPLLPQIESFMEYGKAYLSKKDLIPLLKGIAKQYTSFGDYYKAKPVLEETLMAQKEIYKSLSHIEIVPTLKLLSLTFINLGNYDEARKLLEKILLIQKKFYKNPKDINIALTLKQLARIDSALGLYDITEKTLLDVLNIQKNHYETLDKIEIAMTLKHLGKNYINMGCYEKAKEILEKTITLQEKLYHSRNKMEISFPLKHLGMTELELGNYNKAKKSLEEALKIQRNFYNNKRHIDNAFILVYLARVYLKFADNKKAKTLLEEALQVQEDYYGCKNHINMSFTLKYLGLANIELGRYEEAQNQLELALKIQKTTYETNHIETADTITSLAKLEKYKRNYNKASSLLNDVFNIFKSLKNLNSNHNHLKNAEILRKILI